MKKCGFIDFQREVNSYLKCQERTKEVTEEVANVRKIEVQKFRIGVIIYQQTRKPSKNK